MSAPWAAPTAAATSGPSTISGPAPGTNSDAVPATSPTSPPTQPPVAAAEPAISPVVTNLRRRHVVALSTPLPAWGHALGPRADVGDVGDRPGTVVSRLQVRRCRSRAESAQAGVETAATGAPDRAPDRAAGRSQNPRVRYAPGRMTTTEQVAYLTHFSLTDPISSRLKPPWPREPTTSRSAPSDRRRSTAAGSPASTTRSMSSGVSPPTASRSVRSRAFSARRATSRGSGRPAGSGE
jgi:hypothetical protein